MVNEFHITTGHDHDGTDAKTIVSLGTLTQASNAVVIDINKTGAGGGICVDIDNDGTDHGIYIQQDGVLAASKYALFIYSNAAQINSSLVKLAQNNAASTEVLVTIDNNSSENTIYIDHDSDSASDIYALKFDCDNAGSGKPGGIDFGSFSSGEPIFKLPTDTTDPTGGGGVATGRIALSIGGATRYLAYY